MDIETITTKHKIDRVTYIVSACASEKATDTLHKKIEKLIVRDMRQSAVNTDISRDID